MRGLDPRILFGAPEEDARVKPGHDEQGSGRLVPTILAEYDRRIAAGSLKPDAAQRAVVARLDALAERLKGSAPAAGLLARFKKPPPASRQSKSPIIWPRLMRKSRITHDDFETARHRLAQRQSQGQSGQAAAANHNVRAFSPARHAGLLFGHALCLIAAPRF